MTVTTRHVLLCAVLCVSLAFANIDIGEQLPNPSLPDLDGIDRPFIADGEVSVFVFFHPEQDRSLDVLRQLAEVKNRLADKELYWIGVVSDRFGADTTASALVETGLDLPAVIDDSDSLYGALGVRLYPTVGIADTDGQLVAYLPYARINFTTSVEAQILHALGEIDDDELETVLHPSEVSTGGDAAAAARDLRFARMLVKAGKLGKALEMARAAVEHNPDSADAHAMVGTILAAMDNCEEARDSLHRALELDSGLTTASQALEGCGGDK